MIGIKVISNTNIRNFELNLEKLLAEHPDAKVIFGAIKGIEGGKGMVVVFSFEKKDNSKAEALEKARAVKAEKAAELAKKAAKKAELKAELAELDKGEKAESRNHGRGIGDLNGFSTDQVPY